jgi:hypothetical protein
MAESFIQVAPDSTGKMLRTRNRTVGANSIHEQYVIASPTDAVPINRAYLSTLGIIVPQSGTAIAAAGTVPIFSIWNGIASGGNSVSIRRLSAEIDSVVAHLPASPVLRVFRMTAQAGTPGGTVITPVQQYTAEAVMNALVSVRANHVADGVAGTLVHGTLAAQPLWSQTVPKAATLVGYQPVEEYTLLPNDSNLMSVDPLILRPQEGVAVQLFAPAATAATAGIWRIMIKAVLAEFTYP